MTDDNLYHGQAWLHSATEGRIDIPDLDILGATPQESLDNALIDWQWGFREYAPDLTSIEIEIYVDGKTFSASRKTA
jgi:hypothetical protein